MKEKFMYKSGSLIFTALWFHGPFLTYIVREIVRRDLQLLSLTYLPFLLNILSEQVMKIGVSKKENVSDKCSV